MESVVLDVLVELVEGEDSVVASLELTGPEDAVLVTPKVVAPGVERSAVLESVASLETASEASDVDGCQVESCRGPSTPPRELRSPVESMNSGLSARQPGLISTMLESSTRVTLDLCEAITPEIVTLVAKKSREMGGAKRPKCRVAGELNRPSGPA